MLQSPEIVRIYGKRWQIETFFKFTKSYLNLLIVPNADRFLQNRNSSEFAFLRFLKQ
uniref:transposase n=1 Tax=Brevibacillus agri TaxID=51101 RepID=UPI002867B16A|nr:transposase [Brevibacillus agri]